MQHKPDGVYLAVTLEDGKLDISFFITNPRNGLEDWTREATPENIEAELQKTYLARETKPASWRLIDPAELPQDRSYRAAWRDDGATVGHDMQHAREIHRQRMREVRAPLLADLDIEYQRADEANDRKGKTAVVARKKALREVTDHPAIEAARTIDELQAVWPDELR